MLVLQGAHDVSTRLIIMLNYVQSELKKSTSCRLPTQIVHSTTDSARSVRLLITLFIWSGEKFDKNTITP